MEQTKIETAETYTVASILSNMSCKSKGCIVKQMSEKGKTCDNGNGVYSTRSSDILIGFLK